MIETFKDFKARKGLAKVDFYLVAAKGATYQKSGTPVKVLVYEGAKEDEPEGFVLSDAAAEAVLASQITPDELEVREYEVGKFGLFMPRFSAVLMTFAAPKEL